MASAKIATLLIRTVAKPISAQIKNQAQQHERFRTFCVSLAQMLYRSEVKLRTGILGEPAKHIRPLSETRAVENGANALAEGFLFSVAATLILGEAYRSNRSQTKRREGVDEQLEALTSQVSELASRVRGVEERLGGGPGGVGREVGGEPGVEERVRGVEERTNDLTRITQRIVEFGLRGGWAEFDGTPLQLPRPSPPTTVPPQANDTRLEPPLSEKGKGGEGGKGDEQGES
ncbi:OPA3-domain-containing protein [Mycena alexandri]|uniref:OPA3-domain-containing protein n=1 Tax=Mycena alexandri TaxID=1745969 RepID=A0AAD6SE85_9AGAR|nr:OPA3-domain-containing protein [Mycena alexandri]